MKEIIGGEFELINNTRRINHLSLDEYYIYSSGRAALYNILISHGRKCKETYLSS